jgi:hypothetical protein
MAYNIDSTAGSSKSTATPTQLEDKASKESPSPGDKAETLTTAIEGIEIGNTVPLSTGSEKSSSQKPGPQENSTLTSKHQRPQVNRAPASSDPTTRPRSKLIRLLSAEVDYISLKTKREILKVGWDKEVDSSTSSDVILETLAASSYALGRQTKWPLRVKEREAILVFEELHLRNIQRLQLRLLDISRGCADPPIAKDDEVHRLLHQYR